MTPFFKPILGFIAALLVGCLVMIGTGHAAPGKFYALTQPVALYGETCTNTKICYQVPNDAGISIDLYAAITHPFVYLYVDGVQYKGTFPGAYPYPSNIEDLQMQDADGNLIYLTATFEHYTTCGGGGRGGGYCKLHWTLVGGTITQ